MAWDLLEDSVFPSVMLEIPEAVKYGSLWVTKDAQWIKERKIFWIFVYMNIQMGINRKPWLSPTIYNSLQSFADFKVDFHHVFIRAWKDLMKTWHDLPYLVTDDVVFIVLESWLLEWHALASSTVEINKSTMQRNK